MSSANADYISPQEYLAIERGAETRSEYIDGRMYAMTGASWTHGSIAGNIFRHLRAQMDGRPCYVQMAI